MVGMLLVGLPSATALQPDDVVVLSYGGVDSVSVWELRDDGSGPETKYGGERRILPADIGPVEVGDIKILPDGSHLLANVDGRGAVVTSPMGDVRTVFDEEQRFGSVDAVSAAAYFAVGEPSRILFADSASTSISLRDVAANQLLWLQDLRISSSRGNVVQAIVMPQNRVVSATNWPGLGLTGIDVFTFGEASVSRVRFAKREHFEAPSEVIVVEQVDDVRDIMGTPDGTLLVTARFTIFEMAMDGTVEWSLSTGDSLELSGEFASARLLPGGKLAVATFQPGMWTRPHPNHRLHWIDPDTLDIIATSSALERAPSRVEPLDGHGGTGTSGFTAGLDEVEQGDPDAIELRGGVDLKPEYEHGDRIQTTTILENAGNFPVAFVQVALRASAGECSDVIRSDVDLASADTVTITPDLPLVLSGTTTVDGRFVMGEWCAFIETRDRAGDVRRVGDAVTFEVVEDVEDDESPVEVDELPFNEGLRDMGTDAGDAGGNGGDEAPEGDGCGCASTTESEAIPGAWLVFLGFVVLARRRRRMRYDRAVSD